jgi:hypothetical protein
MVHQLLQHVGAASQHHRVCGVSATTLMFLGVSFVYLAFLPPLIISVDGNSMCAVAESLVERHSFAVAPTGPFALAGRDGLYYSIMYPLVSLAAVPFVALGVFIAKMLHLAAHFVSGVAAIVLTEVLTAASAYLTALLALRFGASLRGAILRRRC